MFVYVGAFLCRLYDKRTLWVESLTLENLHSLTMFIKDFQLE